MHILDVIIPSYDNFDFLRPCLESILRNTMTHGLFHITVINNGHKNSCDWIQNENVTVLQPGQNLGWEGGLKLGLESTKAPYVLFMNDDTHIPVSSSLWLNSMLKHFSDPDVGAVGPSSNVVMGFQNAFTQVVPHVFERKFLIGFCFMVRREAIEKAGGIDDTCPAGDDFDMSIRIRKAGYKLIVDKTVFVYHHGFKTGNRLMGDSQKKNGWNSFEQWEKANTFIIRKHGYREWAETMKDAYEAPTLDIKQSYEDVEGNIIRDLIGDAKDKVVLDLGCGGNKTIESAIGIDMAPKDTIIPAIQGKTESVADIEADVTQPLPVDNVDVIIARHILEHLMDTTQVLKQWKNSLKKGGKLIIAVPNNGRILSIPMNYEHCHGWNPESMWHMLEVMGLKVLKQVDPENGVSFITMVEKI